MFQTPGSLAGTLAAFEARKKSLSSPTGSQEPVTQHIENGRQPQPEAIYSRSLPSLHFLRWRPMYHLQAPSGWMNDPCAPGYDPTTGLYHLFFQWNPKRNVYGAVAWGSICWGHAISKDMIHWTVSGTSSIKPGAWYDKEGCFTGCMVPTGLDGQAGNLTLFYTGVSRLPLHYTLPYKQKTETLAIAQSTNGGGIWTKLRGNPILPEPPIGMTVTGWRDPFVAPWPVMDRLLDRPQSENTLYGVISGGLRDRTPTAFLYAVNPNNLAQWVFLSAIIDLGLNHNISRWSGDMGINWECANFMTLTNEEDGSSREFIVVGGEGSNMTHPNSTFTEYPQQMTKFPRAERSLQWMSGKLRTEHSENGSLVPRMDYVSGGRFDHACMYGVNSFCDVTTGKQMAWGWITEEDLPQKVVDRQNWSGMISLPRELSLVVLKGVTGALKSKLKEITSIETEADSEDTFTVRTLGISPAKSIAALRHGAREVAVHGNPVLSMAGECALDVQTFRFELFATFFVSDACRRIGFSIFHTENLDVAACTSVYLTSGTETLTIERPNSSHIDPNIHTFAETAPFTLFSLRRPEGHIREKLEVRAYFDESVLEVFINNRCSFATRIYPATKRCWGIRFWAEDESQQSRLVQAKAWDGLRADIRVD